MSITNVFYFFLAVFIAALLVFFQYYYKKKETKDVVLPLLRFLAIFTLLLLLINPKITSQHLEDIPPVLNVVIDNSSSIAYSKQDKKVKEFIRNLKKDTRINQKFKVNYYTFSDDLHIGDSLHFNTSKTNIIQTLKTLESLNKNEVAPVVLVTDGNQTYGSNYEFYTSKQPLYTIAVGDTLQYNDLKIDQLNVNLYTQINNKFPVEVFLQYDGKMPVTKTLKITHNNNIVFTKQVRFSSNQNSQKIQCFLEANSVGVQNYKCAITTLANEKNTINNLKNFSVEVLDEKAKILLLSSINHPDISMIKRTIETNKQRKVSIENNLGNRIQFDDYQLVILYQPNREFKGIMDRLKKSTANLFIITGTKTDWNFLNKAQDYFTKKSIANTENYLAVFNTTYDEFLMEDIGFYDLPPLEDYFGAITFLAPHKEMLYQHIANFDTKEPLLSTFKALDRRGAVLFGENSWKWRMLTNVKYQSFEKFDTFFNKIIQYLSSTKRTSQLEVLYKPNVYAKSDAIIKAQFFDATYVFDTTAKLQLSLTNAITKKTKQLPFTLKNNTYQIVLSNLEPSNYTFKVTVKNHKNTSKSGRFTVLNYDIEQQFTTTNSNSFTFISKFC